MASSSGLPARSTGTADASPPLWQLTGRQRGEVAIEDAVRRVTWGDLDERTNAVGHGVEALGLAPGDHVAVVVGNRAEFIEVVLGVQRAGMVVTPLKTSWTPEEIGVVLDDAHSKLIVTDVDAARRAGSDRRVVVVDIDRFEPWLASQDRAPLPADRRGWRMSYTSGTTGRPKGVVHAWSGQSPFSEAFTRSTGWAQAARLPGDGTHLMASQLFHGAPLTFGLAAMALGAPMRIMPRWDPAEFLRHIADGAASTTLVPTMFRQLLALPESERRAVDLKALRTVLHGGEPCPPDLKRRMVEWWGPVCVEYFGFSEGGMTLATTEDWLARPGTVGRALPHQEILVLDDDGRPLPAGTEGTVYFRFLDGTRFSYFGDQAKTEAAYGPDGAFTAGDIGWLDGDGYLYISGRRAEVIVSAGVNVYPAEVEAVIDGVDGVADVAVVGGPDPERGERVVAFVVPAAGVAGEDLIAAVEAASRQRLAGYKRPRQVVLCGEVPRDPTGKLLRTRLHDGLWEGRTGFAASGGS
jgi:long-chain acyl-CoA synthetase